MVEIKAVGLDVDGTLVNEFRKTFEFNRGVIKKHGGTSPSLDEYRKALKGSIDWDSFYGNFGVPEEKWEAALNDFYANHPRHHSAIEGVASAIEKLRIEKYIVTNNPNRRAVIKNLRKGGLYSSINPNAIHNAKGNKSTLIKEIVESYGFHPAETLYVGDSISDIHAAKKAGAIAIGLVHKYGCASQEQMSSAEPHYTINSLHEVKDVIDKIEKESFNKTLEGKAA